MLARFALVAASALALAACAADTSADDDAVAADENAVTVDTRSPAARRQYDANVAFANDYRARCTHSGSTRPRVLVTGFGRFMSVDDNATGRIISTLVPAAVYPETEAPPAGEVDLPGPQLSVGTATLDLEGVGQVDVCAMILPVYWDLAAVLIAKELDAFQPSFVMMNGVAGDVQPLWLELGATNRAAALDDGSNQLRPALKPGETFAPIVPGGDDARANRLSWNAVSAAASAAVAAHAGDLEGLGGEEKLADTLDGVKLAGFPRESNTYLCNNVTYVTGWLMGHPGKTARLMRANPPVRGAVNQVSVHLTHDLSYTPRVFVHWPSDMATKFHAAGADIMKAIIAAQLRELDGAPGREEPSFGDNALADPSLQGGSTF